MWIWLDWFRVGFVGALLWWQWWTFRFHNNREFFFLLMCVFFIPSRMMRLLVNSELERMKKKQPWPTLRNNPVICLKELRKTKKTVRIAVTRQKFERRARPGYESKALPLDSACSQRIHGHRNNWIGHYSAYTVEISWGGWEAMASTCCFRLYPVVRHASLPASWHLCENLMQRR
jgi:hypothetical protein